MPETHKEDSFVWEDTIKILSYEGYYIFEGVSDAQTFLDEHFAEDTLPTWKKTGRLVLQALGKTLRHNPLYPIVRHGY